MAEGKGFEPLNAFDVSRFQDARLRPLGQPSIENIEFCSAILPPETICRKICEFPQIGGPFVEIADRSRGFAQFLKLTAFCRKSGVSALFLRGAGSRLVEIGGD